MLVEKALEGLLDGPLVASREEGPDGHRLRLAGRVVLGSLVYCYERPLVEEFRTALIALAAA
jgi:hypothetical protein